MGLVVFDVTVVSPERAAAPLEHAYVRIRDGTGRYLIPGLIDSHVHLAVPPEQAAAHPDVVAATLAQDPKSYLFFGFTAVIDLMEARPLVLERAVVDILARIPEE